MIIAYRLREGERVRGGVYWRRLREVCNKLLLHWDGCIGTDGLASSLPPSSLPPSSLDTLHVLRFPLLICRCSPLVPDITSQSRVPRMCHPSPFLPFPFPAAATTCRPSSGSTTTPRRAPSPIAARSSSGRRGATRCVRGCLRRGEETQIDEGEGRNKKKCEGRFGKNARGGTKCEGRLGRLGLGEVTYKDRVVFVAQRGAPGR